MNYVLLGLPVAFLVVSVLLSIRAVKKGKKKSRALAIQIFTFLAVCVVSFAVPTIASATTANDTATPTTGTSQAAPVADNSKGMGLLAAALVTSIAGIAGAIAVAAAAPAAIGATSEDPKVFGKALIFVALGEGIALYGLLVSILILNKI
jgi:V/A-type H+/Na+-transporting ATPase subunit K